MDFSLTLDLTINDTLRLLPSYALLCLELRSRVVSLRMFFLREV
jgi:hypothetical protein